MYLLAYYRIQATKRLGGGGGNIKKRLLEKLNEPDKIEKVDKKVDIGVIVNDILDTIDIPQNYTITIKKCSG